MTRVFGTIAPDGGVLRNSGEIVGTDNPETGIYQIKLAPGTFDQEPVVVATALTEKQKCGRSGTDRFVSVTNATADEICFGVVKAGGLAGPDNRGFSFIAMRDD